MTTYIALFNLTDAGIKAAKDSPRRLDAAKKLLANMGGEIEAVLHGDRRFDFVGIYKAPDDAVMASYVLQLRGPRLRAHENAEGVPGDRLPGNHPLARLSPVQVLTAMRGPGESYSDVILRVAAAEGLENEEATQ